MKPIGMKSIERRKRFCPCCRAGEEKGGQRARQTRETELLVEEQLEGFDKPERKET